jgi:hypothetical protein
VLTNDLETPQIRVPVELQVTGGISPMPDTSFCGNLSVVLEAEPGYAGYLWSDGTEGQTLLVDSVGYGTGEQVFWVDVSDIGGATRRDSVLVNFLDCESIFEFSSGLIVSVFPNPNNGQFMVQAEGDLEKITISLSDMNGRKILEKGMESPGKEAVDISNLPKGQYILRIETGKEFKIQKVLYR